MKISMHLSSFQHAAFCLVILFSLINYSQSYSLAGQQIRDLTTNDEASFIQEASAWTLSQYEDRTTFLKHSNCSGILLLGGFGILGSTYLGQSGQYFQRIYKNLPSHQTVRFSLSLWMLDDWAPTDYVQVNLTDDSSKVFSYTTPLNLLHSSNVCGGSAIDLTQYKIYGKVPHSSSRLTITFGSNLNQLSTSKSFGIRDINLLFASNSDSISVICPDPKASNFQCACPIGSFFYFKDCQPCASSCEMCYDGLSTQCYRCKSGYYFDGSTCNKCHSSCTICSGPNQTQCLECNVGYVMFQGICRLSCASTTDYLYYNDSCYGECLSPRTIQTVGTAKFCLEGPPIVPEEPSEPTEPTIPQNNTQDPLVRNTPRNIKNLYDIILTNVVWIIVGVSAGVGLLIVTIAVYCLIRGRQSLKQQVKPAQINPAQELSNAHLNNIPSFARDIIERPPRISQLVEGFDDNQYPDSPISIFGERDEAENIVKLNFTPSNSMLKDL